MPDKTDSFADCDSEGYLLEFDVKYPKELQNLHNDLPFMCEKMMIQTNFDYCSSGSGQNSVIPVVCNVPE